MGVYANGRAPDVDESMLYLREALDSGTVARAEILLVDGSVRASTGRGLTSSTERKQLVGLFENPTNAVATGITVDSVTYVAAEADSRLLHGKLGNAGVVAAKNAPYIVVAHYEEGHRSADAVLTVGNLADLIASRSPPSPSPPPDMGTKSPDPGTGRQR
ncbi:profilin [Streptomyces sp. NPDC001553]|uniref:profilin n=1 Tax=Streptomyces sp. NPDC001553 TaxID=3154385 RepID=UPI00332A90DA